MQLSGRGAVNPATTGRDVIDRAAELRTGVFVLVVLTAGAYLPSPLYPGYQRAFEFTDLTMTLIYAMFALISAPALLLFGSASDVLGPRSVLRAGIAVAAVGSGCFVLASGPMWLAGGRAAQGLALGLATGAAGALISERTPGSHTRRGPVLASTAFLAGTAAGPVAGGVLAQYLPVPHVLPYVLHLALLVYGWRRASRLTVPSARRVRRWRPTWPRIPRGTGALFAAAALTGFLAWTGAGLFLAVIPSLFNRGTTANLAVTGCVLGAVLTCSVLTQPLAAYLGPRCAQFAGLGALLVGLGALALTAGTSVPVTLVAAVAAGAGNGLAYGGAAAAIDAAAPSGQRASITGALYLAFYLGSGCPAVVVGLLTLWAPLTSATSWVAATGAALVPLAAASVGYTMRAGSTFRPLSRITTIPDSHRGHSEQPGTGGVGGRARDWLARPCGILVPGSRLRTDRCASVTHEYGRTERFHGG